MNEMYIIIGMVHYKGDHEERLSDAFFRSPLFVFGKPGLPETVVTIRPKSTNASRWYAIKQSLYYATKLLGD